MAPVTVSVAVLIERNPLDIVIHIRALHHLREIQRHAVKDGPCLSVGTDVSVASAGNGRCVDRQLLDDEDNYCKDKYRHDQLREGDTFILSLRLCELELVRSLLLSA